MNRTLNFTKEMFINNYNDVEDDIPCNLLINSSPLKGLLYLNENIINIPFEISICEIENLKYIADENEYGEDSFLFQIIDSNINNPQISNMATFTIIIGNQPNQPPTQVGNNTVNTEYNTQITITTAMLTTQTTPPYLDPEGDAPFKLKVLSLPSQGVLKLNNSNVVVNQEILFSDINNGLLKYQPNSNTTNQHSVNFNFAISDSGSLQFTS